MCTTKDVKMTWQCRAQKKWTEIGYEKLHHYFYEWMELADVFKKKKSYVTLHIEIINENNSLKTNIS